MHWTELTELFLLVLAGIAVLACVRWGSDLN